MAKAGGKARRGGPGTAAASGGTGVLSGVVVWIALALVAVLAFPTVMVVVVGMAPTLVARFIERRAGGGASHCIATMNLAGVAPVVALLWGRGNTFDAALLLLGDVFNWLLMFGAAATAMAILWFMERAATASFRATARRRLRWLISRQEKLISEWGEGVGAV